MDYSNFSFQKNLITNKTYFSVLEITYKYISYKPLTSVAKNPHSKAAIYNTKHEKWMHVLWSAPVYQDLDSVYV